jgi:putative DNA methylase
MTQQYPKRLIEVDLPIKRISAHARREKSIRHGHISTLHIWWARRPLAACRAVICAALWPDPDDPLCPQDFRDKASRLITEFANAAVTDRTLGESCDHQTWVKWQALVKSGGLDGRKEAHWNVLRFALLDFIADFANWDNSTVKDYLDTSRALTQAAHEALGGDPGTRPLVADPFAGGGSIPLEALRVGADAFASDLNPVPVLLNKVVLEYIPKYGQRLADEVQRLGQWIERECEDELGKFYPKEPDGNPSMAYLWARTIISDAPGEDVVPVEVPLFRSMWLCSKPARRSAFRWVRDSNGHVRTETVKVAYSDGTELVVRRPILQIFQPRSPTEVEKGTSQGGAATCPVTGFTTSVERVREQLKLRAGGAADARLLCIVATPKDAPGRVYRPPTLADLAGVDEARKELAKRVAVKVDRLPLLPEGSLNHLRGFFNVVLYGMTTWGSLFAPRQALSLCYLVSLIRDIHNKYGSDDFGIAVQTCLAMALDRCADKCASVVVWHIPGEKVEHVFGRQALPMVWDFAEANILSDIGWMGACQWVHKVIENNAKCNLSIGNVAQASATAHPLPDDTVDAVITDPPYYAAIPYADLSDFFYSWLRRSVGVIHPELFKSALTPKDDECVQLSHRAAMYRQKDAAWFESMMTKACAEANRIAKPQSINITVFANKETSGWEAMLAALISAGWVITASWPIDTEMGTRLRARNSAALASSVHLVCRPRKKIDDSLRSRNIGDWRDVLLELPRRIHQWMPRLAEEGVVGADAIFACIGPALEIFSRYSSVEKANGEAVNLKEYLEHVWAAVAKEALVMVFKGADATGFEADARLTAMWLWTLMSPDGNSEDSDEESDSEDESEGKKAKTGGFALDYDAARKIAQGLGADLESLGHLVEIAGEQARLLPVSERTRHLFGKDEEEPARKIGKKKKSAQLDMFAELTESTDAEAAWREKTVKRVGETTLDRVHQGMILFAAGRGEALKRFIVDDGVGRDGKFWRLAQALSALYPSGSDEKRWVDGVLARKKQFGF